MKTVSVERMVVCCCWLIASAGSVLPMALDLTIIVEEARNFWHWQNYIRGKIWSQWLRTYQISHQKLQILAKDQRRICMSKIIQCAPSKQYALRQTMEWNFIPYWLNCKKQEQMGEELISSISKQSRVPEESSALPLISVSALRETHAGISTVRRSPRSLLICTVHALWGGRRSSRDVGRARHTRSVDYIPASADTANAPRDLCSLKVTHVSSLHTLV